MLKFPWADVLAEQMFTILSAQDSILREAVIVLRTLRQVANSNSPLRRHIALSATLFFVNFLVPSSCRRKYSYKTKHVFGWTRALSGKILPVCVYRSLITVDVLIASVTSTQLGQDDGL